MCMYEGDRRIDTRLAVKNHLGAVLSCPVLGYCVLSFCRLCVLLFLSSSTSFPLLLPHLYSLSCPTLPAHICHSIFIIFLTPACLLAYHPLTRYPYPSSIPIGKEFIDAQAILRSCGLGLFDLRVDSLIGLYKDR